MFQLDPPVLAAPTATRLPVAILGAGVTGLTAAYRLHKAGVSVRVFEASQRIGGAVHSVESDGWLSESGPNTLQLNSRSFTTLIEDLGLGGRLLEANSAAKKRFLVRRGRPCAAPSSLGSFITSPLLSPLAKLRLFRDLTLRPLERSDDLPLADFVAAHLGREVVDNAFSAFVSGVYAGDADRLSARLSFPSLWKAERQSGSLLKGLIREARERRRRGEPKSRLISFEGGLQQLPAALAAALPEGSIDTSAAVVHLTPPKPGGAWSVRWLREGVPFQDSFSAVLCALPPHALARLTLGPDARTPFADLNGIESPPVTSLFLGYRRADVAHPLDGFGMLCPPHEQRKILGVLFSSSLFPNRAPADHVALTVMIGGALRPDSAILDDSALLALVREELHALLGVTGEPVFHRRTTWPQAIPQYTLGYERFLDAIALAEHTYSGLFVGGPVKNGISVPQCLEAGTRLAERCLA